MPFSGNSFAFDYSEHLDKILDKLNNLNFNGIVGNPDLSHTDGARIALDGSNQTILTEAKITDKTYVREVIITNTSNDELLVFVGSSKIPFRLAPGQTFREQTNKQQVSIQGQADATIELIVRSNFTIAGIIGAEEDEMPVSIKIKLAIGTGENYSSPFERFFDNPSNEFEQNAVKFLDSEQNITGYKVVIVDQFQMGQAINFAVTADPVVTVTSSVVGFQWLDLERIMGLIGAVASDVINPEYGSIDSAIAGALSQNLWASNVQNNLLTLSPTMTSYVGRFVATNPGTGKYDTVVVSKYTPNPDPYQGGTFELKGF
ncbi:MAG: hypothetical protein ACRC8A_16960 [Microcoleaceae cyanobacterium]